MIREMEDRAVKNWTKLSVQHQIIIEYRETDENQQKTN